MHAAWTAFIRTGDPSADGLPTWPTYEPDNRAVMEFGDGVQLLVDPDSITRQAWEGHR